MANTGVQTDKTKESVVEILKELTQINDSKPIAQDEFEKEKNGAILSIPGDWQTNNGIIGFLQRSILFDRGLDYPNQYATNLENLSLSDMHNVAKKVVKAQNLTWLIVGDRAKIESGIRELNLGPVKILDKDGKEIK